MHKIHASTGGGSPLPVDCNDTKTQKLLTGRQLANAIHQSREYVDTPRKTSSFSLNAGISNALSDEKGQRCGCLPSTLLVAKREEPGETLRCFRCGKSFDPSEGYVHAHGSFYCDRDVWLLAENGEFYCGD
jgi:hypothetical protein